MSCVRIFVYSSIADNAEPFFLGRYRTSTVSYQGMTKNFRRVCRVVEPSHFSSAPAPYLYIVILAQAPG